MMGVISTQQSYVVPHTSDIMLIEQTTFTSPTLGIFITKIANQNIDSGSWIHMSVKHIAQASCLHT